MKNTVAIACLLLFVKMSAQEHFSGISTSQRTGIINAGINPAELANLSTQYDVNVFATSVRASSNKVGFSDLLKDWDQLETKLFDGNDAASLSLDAEIYGPGIAIKVDKWGYRLLQKRSRS